MSLISVGGVGGGRKVLAFPFGFKVSIACQNFGNFIFFGQFCVKILGYFIFCGQFCVKILDKFVRLKFSACPRKPLFPFPFPFLETNRLFSFGGHLNFFFLDRRTVSISVKTFFFSFFGDHLNFFISLQITSIWTKKLSQF